MIAPADMVLFAAVVREGSFTRAARRLGITKQTVSERIGKLEAAARVRLLERTTRSLRLTDAGEAYAQRYALIAAQIDEANAELSRRLAEPTGVLRVSAPVLYGRRFLAPVVADYMRRFPAVRVEVVLADRRVNLIEEGFDLAIRVGALDDSSLRATKLGEGYMYYVASPDFIARHGAPAATALAATRCIGLGRHETWTVAGAPSKVQPVLVVSDLEMACDAAIAGVGVARLPSLVCRDAVHAGRLVVVLEPTQAQLRPVYAVYPSRAYLPAKVRLFVDTLSAMVDPMLPIEVDRRAAGELGGAVTERAGARRARASRRRRSPAPPRRGGRR
ncbi:MAG TPA: LysR family transcriptional regulator [Kofleriaceae bacterium]|nr:LysR family transcriptional regulator [Kofleriaceae bacterium]